MKKTSFIVLSLITTSQLFAQSVWTGSTTATNTTGKVGIGVTAPVSKLEIKANNATGSSDPSALKITNINGGGTGNILEIFTGDLVIPPNTASIFAVNRLGQVRIGSIAPNGLYANYKLGVDGDIIAKRCVIQIDSWADHVFHKNYKLLSLNEVSQYIQNNKHLPGIPSEREVKDKGVDIGAMNKALLAKVEELTLYLIQLKKENDEIKDLMKRNGIK